MYKISIIFRQVTGKGKAGSYSETWYVDGSQATAEQAIDAYAKRRAAFLTNKSRIVAARAQLVGGACKLFKMNYPGVLGTDGDIPQMALNCTVQGQGVGNKKSFQLRGIPDGNVFDGDFEPNEQFNAAFTQWVSSLNTRQIRFRGKDLTASQIAIVQVTDLGVFSLQAALNFNVGDTVQLIRAHNTIGKNVCGMYYVSAKTSNQSGTLLNWTGGTVTLKGKMRVSTYIYPLVDSNTVEQQDITTRKVGRPFGLYRGRQTKR